MLECLKNLYFHSGIFEGKDRNFPLNGTEGMGGGVTLYVYVHDQVKGGGGISSALMPSYSDVGLRIGWVDLQKH